MDQKHPFYQRATEIQYLQDALDWVRRECSRMIVVSGHLCASKTRFVNEAFANIPEPSFFLYVNKDMTIEGNLKAFCADNDKTWETSSANTVPTSFEELINELLVRSETTPLVLVVDTIENFRSVDSSFFSVLQKLRDRRRKSTRMLLVLTGRKVDGLFNNINARFCGRTGTQSVLLPFSMVTVRRILCDYNPKWTTENLMMVHMITGSVA